MAETYVRLTDGKVIHSDQIADDVVVDYDAMGGVVGVELLSDVAMAKRNEWVSRAITTSPKAAAA